MGSILPHAIEGRWAIRVPLLGCCCRCCSTSCFSSAPGGNQPQRQQKIGTACSRRGDAAEMVRAAQSSRWVLWCAESVLVLEVAQARAGESGGSRGEVKRGRQLRWECDLATLPCGSDRGSRQTRVVEKTPSLILAGGRMHCALLSRCCTAGRVFGRWRRCFELTSRVVRCFCGATQSRVSSGAGGNGQRDSGTAQAEVTQ